MEQAGGVYQWYGLYDAAHQDIKNGSAVILSGHMIFHSEYKKVIEFIDTNNQLEADNKTYSRTAHPNKQELDFHRSGIVSQNNKVLDTVCNIIDLEGNLYDATAEANSSTSRIYCGGNYNSNWGKYNPMITTCPVFPDNTSSTSAVSSNSDLGVRQALYVTL